MWNEIHTEDDINNLMNSYGHFHDSCIKEIRYVSGAFVGADMCMNPMNTLRTVDVIFQRQNRNYTTIVIRFLRLDTLHLSPQKENYSCEIHNAMIFFKDNLVYWLDGLTTESEIEDYSGTWLCAEKLQWRVIDECFENDNVFRAIFD